jgi:uncharacterized damage-inducible protein DinB
VNPQALLPEFDREIASTRNLLERVPDEKLDWRPHPRSWTLGELATHVANLPGWGGFTLTTDGLDLADTPPAQPRTDRQGILALLEETSTSARKALEDATPEQMEEDWTLRMGKDVVFTLPKGVVYRTTVMNHLIHHRGQLSVYLRMLDVPVPGLYGPSADDLEGRT